MNFKHIILFLIATFIISCISECVPDLINLLEDSDEIKYGGIKVGSTKPCSTKIVARFIPLLNIYKNKHSIDKNAKLFSLTCIYIYIYIN